MDPGSSGTPFLLATSCSPFRVWPVDQTCWPSAVLLLPTLCFLGTCHLALFPHASLVCKPMLDVADALTRS